MMANRRSPFQQSDVTRALKGAIAAGLDPREISIVLRDGEIRIEPVVAREARTVGANSVDAILNGKTR